MENRRPSLDRIPSLDRNLKEFEGFTLEEVLLEIHGLRAKFTVEDLRGYLDKYWKEIITVHEQKIRFKIHPDHLTRIETEKSKKDRLGPARINVSDDTLARRNSDPRFESGDLEAIERQIKRGVKKSRFRK